MNKCNHAEARHGKLPVAGKTLMKKEIMNTSISSSLDLSRLKISKQHTADLLRLATLIQEEVSHQIAWPKQADVEMQTLAEAVEPAKLWAEISSIKKHQCLSRYKHYSTYYTRGAQTPYVVQDIRRLREKSFRLMDEGSGNPQDSDIKDFDYIHLFVFDHKDKRMARQQNLWVNLGSGKAPSV